MRKQKKYAAYYNGMKNEILTNLVVDFMESYGWIGMTARDLCRLFDDWLYWKRRKYKEENKTDEESYKFLFEEQHEILERIIICMEGSNSVL